jgi:hypothetical protein
MIKFRLKFGGEVKPPFVGVRVEKAKDGRAYRVSVRESVLQSVVSYIAKGLLMGPRTFVITLVAPLLKGEARAALRAGLPRLAADLRSEIEQRVKKALEGVKGREVALFKGQKSYVPGWAITARVLLCPERAQEEFDNWARSLQIDYLQEKEEKELRELDEDEDRFFLEGPHFGDIEERAEKILLKLITEEDRFELELVEEGGLAASLARARRIKREGIIAPLVQNRAEALRVIEDYQVLRARESTSSTDLNVDLTRAMYDKAYLAEAAVSLLNALGLDWPARILGGKLPPVEGVHPLFVILEAARLEAAWGRLMDRLGSEDFDLLKAARRFQKLLAEGLSVEEALEALKGSVRGEDFPVEVAILLTEGSRRAEFIDDENEEPLLLDEDNILKEFQQEALEEALLAWGFKSSEEALEALEALGEDPLAQAFKKDVQERFASKRLAVGM